MWATFGRASHLGHAHETHEAEHAYGLQVRPLCGRGGSGIPRDGRCHVQEERRGEVPEGRGREVGEGSGRAKRV